MSLAEALITLGLLCVFMVPSIHMLRQSSVNYGHAYADYQTDLIAAGLLTQAKDYAVSYGIADFSQNFSPYGYEDRFEYEIRIDELHTGQSVCYRYPVSCGLDVRPAFLSKPGNFSGLITAAVRDTRTGVTKIKALPF